MRRDLLVVLVLLGCSRNAPPPRTNASVSETPPPHTTVSVSTNDDAGAPPAAVEDAAVATVADASSAAEPARDRPLYYERAITDDDLRGRSLRELALMRNMPYARMGHRFRRPWLNRHFSGQEWYHPTRFVQANELSALDRQNSDAVGRYDVALERADLERMRDALLQRDRDGHSLPADSEEAVLLSSRLGERVTLSGVPLADAYTPLENPAALDSLLTLETLRQLSPRDLRILRNMVRARHGATFRAQSLRDYFEPAEWYHPDTAYNDARLTRVDRQNIRLIQTVEAEFGGPMTEAQVHEEDLSGA